MNQSALKSGSISIYRTPNDKEIAFFRCGQSGHMSYECPKKNRSHVRVKQKEECKEQRMAMYPAKMMIYS